MGRASNRKRQQRAAGPALDTYELLLVGDPRDLDGIELMGVLKVKQGTTLEDAYRAACYMYGSIEGLRLEGAQLWVPADRFKVRPA